MASCMPLVAMSSRTCAFEMSPGRDRLRTPITHWSTRTVPETCVCIGVSSAICRGTPIAHWSPRTVAETCVCIGVSSAVCRGTPATVHTYVKMLISRETCFSAPEFMTYMLTGMPEAIKWVSVSGETCWAQDSVEALWTAVIGEACWA